MNENDRLQAEMLAQYEVHTRLAREQEARTYERSRALRRLQAASTIAASLMQVRRLISDQIAIDAVLILRQIEVALAKEDP